jgi:multidrug efflux pump subunit AcrA (membrane-fusion protein)
LEEADKSTRISLEKTPEEFGLELGDLVRVEVVVERQDTVLWLPPQAIRTFDGRKFVVVQDGELQRRVDVKIGVEGEDRVEIEEGLAEGQVVVGL